MGALTHQGKHAVAHMFGGDFELTADMIETKLPEKSFIFVHHEIVKTDAASDENFFYTGKCTKLLKQCDVFSVVNFYIWTRMGAHTVTVRTDRKSTRLNSSHQIISY